MSVKPGRMDEKERLLEGEEEMGEEKDGLWS